MSEQREARELGPRHHHCLHRRQRRHRGHPLAVVDASRQCLGPQGKENIRRGQGYSFGVDRNEACLLLSGERVGLVCGFLDPTRDGVADYTRRLAVELRRAGFEPLVITTHEWARVGGQGAVGATKRWNVSGVVAAARVLRRLDVDVVHVQFAPSVFGFSRAVGLLPLFLPRGMRLVVTLHEYGVWSAHGRGVRGRSALWSALEALGWIDRETLLLAPWADRLLVPAPEHVDVLRIRFPRRSAAVLEVPIGLNVEVTTGE